MGKRRPGDFARVQGFGMSREKKIGNGTTTQLLKPCPHFHRTSTSLLLVGVLELSVMELHQTTSYCKASGLVRDKEQNLIWSKQKEENRELGHEVQGGGIISGIGY